MLSRHRGARVLRELDAHRLGNSRLLHGHAVERVGAFHGALVVGDDDELRGLAHLADHLVVAADVGIVERRVHLVEEAEGRRLDEEDGEDEGYGGERLLAAGEQVDAGELLSGRLGDDLHAGFALWILGVGNELQLGAAAAEEPGEDLLELLVHEGESLAEPLFAGALDAGDRRPQPRDRFLQVLVPRGEERVALAHLAGLVDGGEAHLAERLDGGAELLHPSIGRVHVERERFLALRGGRLAKLEQMALAHSFLEMAEGEPDLVDPQLDLGPRPRYRFQGASGLVDLLVAAAQPFLGCIVQSASPSELAADLFTGGEEAAPVRAGGFELHFHRAPPPGRGPWLTGATRATPPGTLPTPRSRPPPDSSPARSSWARRFTVSSSAACRVSSSWARAVESATRASSSCTVPASSCNSRRLCKSPSATPASEPPETIPSRSTTSPSAETNVRSPGLRAQSESADASVSQRKTSARRNRLSRSCSGAHSTTSMARTVPSGADSSAASATRGSCSISVSGTKEARPCEALRKYSTARNPAAWLSTSTSCRRSPRTASMARSWAGSVRRTSATR